ncbi:MAG: MFS transporter [Desulfurococcales archaeon]|nr:MFS transporter [Desulfurococcales archaeon]MCE4627359.1 MFS transporter [Desulfurococcales archaeon]
MRIRLKLIILYTGLFIAAVAAGIARPAIAYYVKYDIGSTMLAAAGLTSGFMAGRALASLASGFLSEVLPRYRWLVVLVGLAISGMVLYVVIPSSRSASTVIVAMGLWGIVSGFIWPSLQIVTSELGGSRSGTAMAIYFALGGLGISIGNWYFGYSKLSYAQLIEISGIAMASSGLVLAYASYGIYKRGTSDVKSAVKRVLNPVILWVILSAFTLGFLSGILREYFYIYVHEVYGLSKDSLGELLLVSGLMSVIGGLIAGGLADKIGIARALYFVLIISALSSIGLGLPFLGVFIVSAAYVGANTGVRASMPLTRNAALAGDVGGSLMVGASNTASSLGMMTGPLVAGLLYEVSPAYGGLPFLASGFLLFLTIILYRRITG